MNKVIKSSLSLLLVALGFSACTKPDKGTTGDIVCYYGPMPALYQDKPDSEDIITEKTGTETSVEPEVSDNRQR